MLNARRHRDGDQVHRSGAAVTDLACSTPGGIETVIRRAIADVRAEIVEQCSTPGGIETVIRPEIAAKCARLRRCSTPGGIETVISRGALRGCDPEPRVLNARRHRDGDQSSLRNLDASIPPSAQRPEASRR